MGTTFEQAMAGLQPGQISAPVLTASGYHVFRLESRRDVSVEAVRENARRMMLQDLAGTKLEDRIDELRRVARVEVLLPPRRQTKVSEGK